jgi:8-oxo-dGTP pyrophosphatase MutT (NUDIX family)
MIVNIITYSWEWVLRWSVVRFIIEITLQSKNISNSDKLYIMDYIQQLRQIVGHRPILMVGAAILVVDNENRLLLMKRTDSGCWGLPGGSVEPGEEVEEAAKRETLEETGLQINGMTLFGLFSGEDLHYIYPNGDEVYNVTIVYLSHYTRGTVRINQEHSEWSWFNVADIPIDISPPIKPVIEQYRKMYR